MPSLAASLTAAARDETPILAAHARPTNPADYALPGVTADEAALL